jgi:hypothetical protein
MATITGILRYKYIIEICSFKIRQEMNCQHAIIIENVEGQKSSLALCKLINCI